MGLLYLYLSFVVSNTQCMSAICHKWMCKLQLILAYFIVLIAGFHKQGIPVNFLSIASKSADVTKFVVYKELNKADFRETRVSFL
jgi:hypothetical protein